MFGGKGSGNINKIQSVQKNTGNMDTGRHGKSKVNRNHKIVENKMFENNEITK